MGRYDRALNKKHTHTEPEKIQAFDFGPIKGTGHFEFFRPHPGSTSRVGIVFVDRRRLFIGTQIHYYNKFFLCRSTESNKEICCERIGKPSYRVACAVIVYGPSHVNHLNHPFRVLPWLFPRSNYLKLNDHHNLSPLDSNDFLISRAMGDRFNDFSFDIAEGESLWQVSERKVEIVSTAIPIINNLKNYLGQDLSSFEIDNLLKEPKRTSFNRNTVSINRRLDQI